MVSCTLDRVSGATCHGPHFFLVANLGQTMAALGHWVVVVELEWCTVECDGCYSTNCFLVS
jgi:hypothetical protein